MKKVIQRLALMAIALLSSAAASAQSFDVGDFSYTVLDATEQTVSIKAKGAISGPLTIPATVENEGVTYKVTKVADNGFNKQETVSSITFEGNNLVEIGKSAFKSTTAVTGSITIPASVKVIEYEGFCYCNATEFVFAEGSQLERLGDPYGNGDVFWDTKIRTMPNLPNTLTQLGDECFKRCSELTEAWLPSSITKIPYATFAENPKLETAIISASVTEVGEAVFWSCPLLTSVTFEASTEPLKLVGRTFQYCYALESITLPDRINEMGEGVFLDCKSLASAHFPTGMTVVPAKTFDNCYALASVTGIDQVTRLEASAFGDCHEFTSFTIPAGVTFIGDWALGNQTNCATYTFAGNNVTTIGSNAFKNNKAMTSFTLPTSVTSLGNSVFEGCTELTSFDLPSGVTIGTGLFSGCSKLASVTLPEGLAEIPNYMFDGCSALAEKFTIPASVKRIGTDAFRACNNITEVEFPENSQLEVIGWEAFYMDYTKSKLERFIMPNTVTTLENGALRGCKKLDWENFHLSPLVTFLPGHVFCDCGFTKFPLEETNVTAMDYNVFDGNCFTEFRMPANVTYGNACFYANHKLERFYFEDGSDVAEIKYYMFNNCENLNYIYLPVTTPPTLGSYSLPEAKQLFMDVPTEAIETYKNTSGWGNFKYAITLESDGATALALDDATQRYWDIYNKNGHRYLYNDQASYSGDLDKNLMSWTFNNTVEKEYSLLFNSANRYNCENNECLEVSLVKYNADGTQTTVQSKTVKISKYKLYDYYAYADFYEQVLVNFDEALEVGKYAVTFKRLGDNGKFVWNAQMVPTADLCIIEPAASPAGAGEIAVTGDLIQVKGNNTEITLTAATMDGASWISFGNWTVDGAQVGTEGNNVYTFTPTASAKVVANYEIVPQNIPADLNNFVQTQAVLYPANPTNSRNSIYWYPNTGGTDNYVYIHDGNSATYFVKSTKPALYNLKFKTSSKNYDSSAYIVDVINADGDVIFTKQNDIAQTPNGWYNDDMNQEEVAITTPLLPNEVYSVRFTFISKAGKTDEIANLNFVQFEAAAIVPDAIALDKTAETIKVEDNETLTATVSASTGDAITEGYDGVVWTSSNAEVATVENGVVTAVAPGTATITAKATGRTDIELTAACEVTVPQHVTDITVSAAQSIYVGENVTLEATALPENAEDKTFTWVSGNTEVATVDADGKVTAVAKGNAVITVTAADRNKVSKTVAVEVKQQVNDITGIPTATQIIYVGENVQITAVAAPETANVKTLTWTSSDETVATVSETGKITAVKAGSATITVTAADRGTFQKTINVTVKQQVTDITVDATAEVYTGETVAIDATTVPAEPTDGTLTWASADETIATVSTAGVVTGVKAGTVNITVTAADRGTVSKTIAVTVKQAVTAIALNKTSEKIHKGETLQLTATCVPDDATLKTVTWTSNAPAIATVSETGLVTAVAGGVATITATANDGKGTTATCTVTVDVPVTSVTLNETSKNVYIGEKVVLAATVAPDDATDATVTWTSSNTAVATVVDGTVTAVAAGTAVITAASNYDATKNATFTLTVMDVTAVGTGANQLLLHKVANTPDLTANKVAWDNETDKNWVANSIVLTDANDFTCPYDVAAASLTYKRTFSNTEWQPLYVPFNMAYTEWSDKADVAKISGVHEYDDGTTLIEFRTVKSGEILPNVPYIIRAKATSDEPQEFVCTDKTLSASPATAGTVWCASTERRYTLTGTYTSTTGLDGTLGMSGGTFYTITNSETVLKAMRFYLTIADENHGYGSGSPALSAPSKVHIMVDGVATGITILGNEINNAAPAYNTQGVRVDENYKGIVIQNGKKTLRK